MMTQTVQLNYLRMTPRKVRLIADTLKGLPVQEAEAQLLFQRRRAAKPLLKLLRGAIANAKNNQRIAVEKLFVLSVRVDQGPMLKRFLPRARGSASEIQKKMSHVTLILGEREHAAKPRFNIAIQKKVKLPPEGTKKSAPKKEKAEERKIETKKPGFFQKVFRRKAGMGK